MDLSKIIIKISSEKFSMQKFGKTILSEEKFSDSADKLRTILMDSNRNSMVMEIIEVE